MIAAFTPYTFQAVTIDAAIKVVTDFGGCCIFDETGLGKTITGAFIAAHFGEKILVVAPKANQYAWKEILPNAEICTKNKISKSAYDVIIVDEAHNFNNAKNKTFTDLIDVIYFQDQPTFPKVILMTATPVNNNMGELVQMLKLIPFKPSCSAFYTVPIAAANVLASEKKWNTMYRFGIDHETGLGKSFRLISESVEIELLYRKSIANFGTVLKEFSFRNTRADISEKYQGDISLMGHFPKVKSTTCESEVNDASVWKTLQIIDKMPMAYYNVANYCDDINNTGMGALIKAFMLKRMDSSIGAFIETLESIRSKFAGIEIGECVTINDDSFCVNSSFWSDLKADQNYIESILQIWTESDDQLKINQLINLIRQADGKVVVFTEYVKTQSILTIELSKHFDCISYNGQSDDSVLDVVVSEFDPNVQKQTNRYKVLIATDALAEGVNLHRATNLIHYDLKWNPSRLLQREGRINRLFRNNITPQDIEVTSFGVSSVLERILRLEQRLDNKRELAYLTLNSSKELQYFKHIPYTSYKCTESSDVFGHYIGLNFKKGALWFSGRAFVTDSSVSFIDWNKDCKLIPTPSHKRNETVGSVIGDLFNKSAYFGYDTRISNMDKFLGHPNRLNVKLIYQNLLYGWMFMDVKVHSKESICQMIDKFFVGVELPTVAKTHNYILEEGEEIGTDIYRFEIVNN